VCAGEGGTSEEEKARMVLEDIVERLPEAYDMEDIRGCALYLFLHMPVLALLIHWLCMAAHTQHLRLPFM
jgi:hypothetical protein